jgi:hypothetical protein
VHRDVLPDGHDRHGRERDSGSHDLGYRLRPRRRRIDLRHRDRRGYGSADREQGGHHLLADGRECRQCDDQYLRRLHDDGPAERDVFREGDKPRGLRRQNLGQYPGAVPGGHLRHADHRDPAGRHGGHRLPARARWVDHRHGDRGRNRRAPRRRHRTGDDPERLHEGRVGGVERCRGLHDCRSPCGRLLPGDQQHAGLPRRGLRRRCVRAVRRDVAGTGDGGRVRHDRTDRLRADRSASGTERRLRRCDYHRGHALRAPRLDRPGHGRAGRSDADVRLRPAVRVEERVVPVRRALRWDPDPAHRRQHLRHGHLSPHGRVRELHGTPQRLLRRHRPVGGLRPGRFRGAAGARDERRDLVPPARCSSAPTSRRAASSRAS